MRSIELKTLPGNPDIEYSSVLKEVLSRPVDQAKGADIQEMRRSIRVLDALDRANGTLELEDADYQYLRDKIGNMHWNVIDRRIVQFVDDILGS